MDGSQLVPEIVGGDLVQLLLDDDARVVVVVANDWRLRGRGQIHGTAGRGVRTGDGGTLRGHF